MIDESIRKGDIQVTVIATGFDADRVQESPMEKMSRITIEDTRRKKDEERKPIIHKEKVTYPTQESELIIKDKVPPRQIRHNFGRIDRIEDEDDELEIPAFIRRKMGK